MTTKNMDKLKRANSMLILCLASGVTVALTISPSLAHGTSSGSESGGLALLIFPVAAVLFVLFLVFTHRKKGWTVLVTGGAGYVGSVLVPKLLQQGHRVVVLDLFPFGDNLYEKYQDHENLHQISGDFTDPVILATALRGCDAVIHLACVTGRTGHEPGSELERATNLAAFGPLVEMAKTAGIKRFIFASSLRGKSFGSMTAQKSRRPLDETDTFLMHKERCEHLLEEARSPGFVVCTVRTADVCGVAPSQRLDSGVNALAWEGFNDGGIRILDGDQQMIPNIHVEDLAAFFLIVLNQPDVRIDGKCCEAISENLTRSEMATAVAAALGKDALLDVEAGVEFVDPKLPYGKVNPGFGFEAKHSVADAVRDLVVSLQDGIIKPLSKN